MLAQVVDRQRAAGRGEGLCLSLAEVAVVVGVEAITREGLQRRGKGRQADPLAWLEGTAVGSEHGVEPAAARLARERGHGLDVLDELVRGSEPVPCQFDGRCQDRFP